jgi:hypothetical protein
LFGLVGKSAEERFRQDMEARKYGQAPAPEEQNWISELVAGPSGQQRNWELQLQQRKSQEERRGRLDPLVQSLLAEGQKGAGTASRAFTQRVEQQYGAESRAMASRGLAQTFGGMSPAMARARGRGIEGRRQTGMVQAEAAGQEVILRSKAQALQAILAEMGITANLEQLYAKLQANPTLGDQLLLTGVQGASQGAGYALGSGG